MVSFVLVVSSNISGGSPCTLLITDYGRVAIYVRVPLGYPEQLSPLYCIVSKTILTVEVKTKKKNLSFLKANLY